MHTGTLSFGDSLQYDVNNKSLKNCISAVDDDDDDVMISWISGWLREQGALSWLKEYKSRGPSTEPCGTP